MTGQQTYHNQILAENDEPSSQSDACPIYVRIAQNLKSEASLAGFIIDWGYHGHEY